MDIMYEVFRAMKHLNFEWKILQAYHCIVRKKPTDSKIEVVNSASVNLTNLKHLAENVTPAVSSRSSQLPLRWAI